MRGVTHRHAGTMPARFIDRFKGGMVDHITGTQKLHDSHPHLAQPNLGHHWKLKPFHAAQTGLPSGDLGLNIFEDAGEVSTVLTDLLGTINVGANPQLDSLLNLDSTFDEIVSLVGSLPDLDLSPITEPVTGIVDTITDITDPVVDPIIDTITDITDPVVDPIVDVITDITDPVVDPIVDVITDITDPVVDPIVEPILDPVTDITDPLVEPILDPILDPIAGGGGLLSGLSSSSSESDSGLLDSLSSGISSSAGSEGGALDGLLGSLDQNK